jgi:hypothetical protein
MYERIMEPKKLYRDRVWVQMDREGGKMVLERHRDCYPAERESLV